MVDLPPFHGVSSHSPMTSRNELIIREDGNPDAAFWARLYHDTFVRFNVPPFDAPFPATSGSLRHPDSWVTARPNISLLCFIDLPSCSPVSKFQTFTVPSLEAVTTRRPSGRNTRFRIPVSGTDPTRRGSSSLSDRCASVTLDILCFGSWLQAGYRVGRFAKVRGEKSEGGAGDLHLQSSIITLLKFDLPHSLAHRVAQLAVEFSPTHHILVVLPGGQPLPRFPVSSIEPWHGVRGVPTQPRSSPLAQDSRTALCPAFPTLAPSPLV